jgi:hypothetical protein
MMRRALCLAAGLALSAAVNAVSALAANAGGIQSVPPVYFHFTDTHGRPVTVGETIFFPNGTNCASAPALAAAAHDMQNRYRALAGLTYVNATCGGKPRPSSIAAAKALGK